MKFELFKRAGGKVAHWEWQCASGSIAGLCSLALADENRATYQVRAESEPGSLSALLEVSADGIILFQGGKNAGLRLAEILPHIQDLAIPPGMTGEEEPA